MNHYKEKHIFISFFLLIIFLLSSLMTPLVNSKNYPIPEGFKTGVSYQPVVPIKKATFIQYDDNSFLDDYAYLASIPTAVFTNGTTLFSSPLLFYQDDLKNIKNKEKTLDAKQGLDYFMTDWTAYCDHQLDQIIGINIDKNKLTEYNAKEYINLQETDPYNLASKIAQHDWSYTDNAVLAVINQNYTRPHIPFSNSIAHTLPQNSIKQLSQFNLEQTNSLNPVYHEFTIPDQYVYVKAETWWDGIKFLGRIMVPPGDPDLQLYCQEDGDWMQAAAISNWNIYTPIGHEYTYSHVYNHGPWRIGITDFPTEMDAPQKNLLGGLISIQGSLLRALSKKVIYHTDITLYPGVTLQLPDQPPFGCRNADFILTWDEPGICLGFSLIGPSGDVIFTSLNESRTDNQEIHIKKLGQCLPNEHYSISVFTLDDITTPVDFKIRYNWEQKISQTEADMLTSATEGSILASTLNAPLLYLSDSIIPPPTTQSLNKLGVKNLYIIDIGNHLKKSQLKDLQNIYNVKTHLTNLTKTYNYIRTQTSSTDIIFSTIDSWTYWYFKELKAAGETNAAYHLGPAAYLAAHHGCPVFIVDMHPELSSATVWHNKFWDTYSDERYNYVPSVADMVLTGRRVYDFLKLYNYDHIGRETIITVAGQFDIGIPWDRVFVGEAQTGRIWGTPIDSSYWISRTIFYPGLIYVNPALNPESQQQLINGSISTRPGLRGLLSTPFINTLSIKRQSQETEVTYPILCSFVTHKYRFNERASKYYGAKYQCADSLIPGETTSMNPIDQGVNKKYLNKEGSYFPDISESEIIPLYLNRGGFDPVFSTELEAVTNNLNQGVILWIHASHGVHKDGGSTLFWDPASGFSTHKLIKPFAGAIKETNPWRGYDWLLGSTQEPDTMSMDYYGFIPFTNINGIIMQATGLDYVLARKPIREKINQLLDFIRIIPFRFRTDNLYDGLTGTISYSKYGLARKNSTQIDYLLDNLYSAGFITSICQTSNTYLHLSLIRHGSVFQIQDPWPTSWYGAVWRQSIPRDIILGDTVGEAYVKGMSHVGILYLGDNGDPPQWWWDNAENVLYFGDPKLRMYVPSTDYSTKNTWNQPQTLRYDQTISITGHMPFGSDNYPYQLRQTTIYDSLIWILLALALIIIVPILFIIKRKHQ